MPPHPPKATRRKPQSEEPTPPQLRWLAANPDYEMVLADHRYSDIGLLTTAGTFYGGTFPIPPVGSIQIGVRKLSLRERKTQSEARRRQKINSNPALKEQHLARRREQWKALMSDPKKLAKERRRNRERMAKKRASDPVFLQHERDRERAAQRRRRAEKKAAQTNQTAKFRVVPQAPARGDSRSESNAEKVGRAPGMLLS
jgi:hypothetical protein